MVFADIAVTKLSHTRADALRVFFVTEFLAILLAFISTAALLITPISPTGSLAIKAAWGSKFRTAFFNTALVKARLAVTQALILTGHRTHCC